MKNVYVAYNPLRVFGSKKEANKFKKIYGVAIHKHKVIENYELYDLYEYKKDAKDDELIERFKEIVDRYDNNYFSEDIKVNFYNSISKYEITITFKVKHDATYEKDEKHLNELFDFCYNTVFVLLKLGYLEDTISDILTEMVNERNK